MSQITVIVPVYNTENYLRRCIDSILTQTFTDFELLLIDDGSTDSSGKICDEYKDKDDRIRVFHKENGGVSSARNLGLDNASGELIAFVDSDDYVLTVFLETYIMLFKENADLYILGIIPDYSISSKYIITNTSLNYNGKIQDVLLQLMSCQMLGSLCNKAFKKSIIDLNGLRFNESYRFREDEEFLLRYMVFAKQVVSTLKKSYVYFVPDWNKYNKTDNLFTNFSMYKSTLLIYKGKSNDVTDSYQIELCNEWLSLLRIDLRRSVKVLPLILKVIGWRFFRITPLKAITKKILSYIVKR